MKKLLVALCGILAVFAFTACGANNAVATVNGEKITEGDYTAYVDNLLKIYEVNGYTLTNEDKASLKDTVIKEMVNQKCVELAAEDMKCYPTDKEVDAFFDKELKATFGDAEQGKSYIKEQGLDLDVYRYSYVVNLCQQNIGKAEVTKNTMTKAEATATFEENPDKYYTRTVSHILVQPDTGDRTVEKDEDGNPIYTDKEWAAAEAEAKALIKKLDDGKDFAKLAKENSADTNSAVNGGALGEPFNKEESTFVKEFTDASFELTKKGQYTETPVRTSFGYHIIKADDVKTEADKDTIIKGILTDNLTNARTEAATNAVDAFQSDADINYIALSDAAKAQMEEGKE